jgi:peptidoglycan/LPS O-acetylase OafA/YrhL
MHNRSTSRFGPGRPSNEICRIYVSLQLKDDEDLPTRYCSLRGAQAFRLRPRGLRGMNNATVLAYRPDIDGMRALAVVAVVGYHAAPGIIRGGYIGVDVFFVISGFLISTIILTERDAGTFSIGGFYVRRIRRLFPALAVVLGATWLLGWFYLLPHEFRALGKHMAAGAAYFVNFTLMHESGYFDSAAGEKPLLHLWSLAVEEQFYIFWPLLLVAVRARRTLIVVIGVLVLASFVGSVMELSKNHQTAAFYLPYYRVWELGAGSLLAAAAMNEGIVRVRNSPLADLGSAVGFALVLGPAVFLAQVLKYPGYFALLPTVGALLLIAAGPRALINRAVLSHPVMVAVGLVSYSLYLWHWPLLSFAHILGHGEDVTVTLLCVAAAALLAGVTYLYVERPLRHARFSALPVGLFGAVMSLCLVGVLSQWSALSPRLNAARYQKISDAIGDWTFPAGLRKVTTPSSLRIHTAGEGADKVLFFGDSNIMQYWPRIERILGHSVEFQSVIFATSGGCVPILGAPHPSRPDCTTFVERGMELAADPSIKSVVIGAAWMAYFNSAEVLSQSNAAFGSLTKTIRELSAQGKTVWLVLNIPIGAGISPKGAVRRTFWGDTKVVPMELSRAEFDRSWGPVRAQLVQAAKSGGGRIIDPSEWMCSDSICPGETENGSPIYTDGSHLRASYVRNYATFMDQTLGITTGSLGK